MKIQKIDTPITYSIRDLSKRYQVRPSTLRYYEDEGLLPFVPRDSAGQRVYSKEHIARLDAIACFKRTGLPIHEIARFFEYEQDLSAHAGDITEMMSGQEKITMQKIEDLTKDLAHIRHKVWFYSEIQKAIENKTVWPKWEDYENVPQKKAHIQ